VVGQAVGPRDANTQYSGAEIMYHSLDLLLCSFNQDIENIMVPPSLACQNPPIYCNRVRLSFHIRTSAALFAPAADLAKNAGQLFWGNNNDQLRPRFIVSRTRDEVYRTNRNRAASGI